MAEAPQGVEEPVRHGNDASTAALGQVGDAVPTGAQTVRVLALPHALGDDELTALEVNVGPPKPEHLLHAARDREARGGQPGRWTPGLQHGGDGQRQWRCDTRCRRTSRRHHGSGGRRKGLRRWRLSIRAYIIELLKRDGID